MAVRLTLEACGPMIGYLEVTIEIHIEAAAVLLIIALDVIITVPLCTYKAMQIYALKRRFIRSNLLCIFIHLLFQRAELAAVFFLKLFQHSLICYGAALLLHCLGYNAGHFITRHRAVSLEGSIRIAFNDAILRKKIQCLITPMILRYIAEAVRSIRGRGQRRSGNPHGKSNQHCCHFLIQFHLLSHPSSIHFSFLSLFLSRRIPV